MRCPLTEPRTAWAVVRPAGVRAEGWGWQYAGRARPAIDGLELTIEPGERVLLLGSSGSGKSTFLQGAAGLLGTELDTEERGRLLVDGLPALSQRGRAGLMHQDPEAQIVFSRIGDDVAFGPENLAVPDGQIWPRVRAALTEVGLGLPLHHPTSQLSGGQKQRLGLAGLIAMQPGLWLLDEPTANLDPAGVVEVRDAIIRALDASGATLVVVEHRVEVWLEVVQRVVVLGSVEREEPAVLYDGPAESLLPEGLAQKAGDSRVQMAARLRGNGIWLPGERLRTRRRQSGIAGNNLLETQALAVSRAVGRRSCRNRPQPAAEGLALEVCAGSALTVTGRNGVGKTALALTLGGLLPPLSGRVLAAPGLSRGLSADPLDWTGAQLIERLGTVFQEPEQQFLAPTVAGELGFGPRLLGRGAERVRELVERLRLGSLLEANPYTLSGGEKRRLSVATVLAASPQLLILDEPTFGQDANTWAELVDLLIELLDDGVAVVAVSHDRHFWEALGGAVLTLGTRRPG